VDKATGLLRLDRVLYSAVYHPADYGFIRRTYCDDDLLDLLVLGQEPVDPLTIVDARAIGVMRMRDEKGVDDKIVALSVHDPATPNTRIRTSYRTTCFDKSGGFSDYKTLERKQVVVEDLLGPDDALAITRAGLKLYRTRQDRD
jgi:inorganic pyrophosphatase